MNSLNTRDPKLIQKICTVYGINDISLRSYFYHQEKENRFITFISIMLGTLFGFMLSKNNLIVLVIGLIFITSLLIYFQIRNNKKINEFYKQEMTLVSQGKKLGMDLD